MRLRFRTQLLASYVGLVIAVEGIALYQIDRSLSADLVARLDERLEQQARGVAEWVPEGKHPQKLAPRLKKVVNARVTILDRYGIVLGDSDKPDGLQGMDSEGTPPEVVAAREGRVGRATRYSATFGEDTHFVAVLADRGMVIRLSVPLAEIESTLSANRRELLYIAGMAFVAAVLLGFLAARLAAKPLRAMTASAERIAKGDFDIGVPDAPDDEFGTLARSLSSLASQLKSRIGELTAEREQLRRLETIRRDFVANVSHELRTPVAAVQAAAETLGRPMTEAERAEFAAVIERHATRMGRLVEDLLRLAELEARRPETTPREAVAVAGVAAQVSRTVAARARTAGAKVTVEVDADVIALADPVGLEQVLENLVANAIKYGNRGGTVRITGQTEAGRARIVVSDDGPGIAPAHLGRIFERFYRVDPGRSREQGGTGLGLAIVKHLVEAMSGTVVAESQPGHGTQFRVDLPAASDSDITITKTA